MAVEDTSELTQEFTPDELIDNFLLEIMKTPNNPNPNVIRDMILVLLQKILENYNDESEGSPPDQETLPAT